MPRVPVVAAALLAAVALASAPAAYAAAPTANRTAGVPATATGQVTRALGADTSGPDGSMRRTGSSAVALTFDDGPDPNVTPKLLDLLKKNRVRATFCVVGHRARDNQAIIRRIINEGHTICNHSWQHLQDLGKRDDATIRKDLAATSKWIRRAAPGVSVDYFRAPYGNFTPRLDAIARSMGMTPLSWSVDDQAWMSATYGKGATMVAHMTSVVKKNTTKGSIVLSHEMAKPWTVTAYTALLPWLKKRFTLVALPTVSVAIPRRLVPSPSPTT